MTLLSDISQEIKTYNPQADLSLIAKAYRFAEAVHQGQKRASGEPYLIHPLEVAQILTQMKMDVSSIAAGLLHDTIEDTLTPLEQIKKEFGSEVATLVDGVTKLGKIEFSSAEEKQAENFRKMIMAMARDIRVVLIKLADRLNNMRTLQYLPEERRLKIAHETMDIYAPLANRLGIQWMKVELEELSFKYLKTEIYNEIDSKMSPVRKEAESYIQRVTSILTPKLNEYDIPHKIYGRLKHYFSIYRKMEAQNISFEQVHDLIAFRIIVEDIRQCYAVLGIIHELWTPVPGRFKDYIAMPKTNNYRSLHTTVICIDGERAEFQIRTQEMHEIAEKGIAAHWKYKDDGSIEESDQQRFQWVQELLQWQKDLKDPAEFLDTVKLDLFATDVYVFTPKGEVRELPHGSTPIDFAYAIHSDIGNQCIGARVNEKIVPLHYHLRSGDTIEILTQAHHKPSKDWLKFAVTSRARSKIRSVIKLEQRERSILIGKELIEKEFARFDLNPTKFLKGESLDHLLKETGFQNLDSLAISVGYGKLSPLSVVSKLVPKEILLEKTVESSKPETVLSKIFKKVKERGRSIVKVGGYDDILVSLGRCCSPLPGDSIVGFITRGRGVVVHLSDCPKVLATDPERRVEVAWDERTDSSHHAKLKVVSSDRPGLLASMSKIISNEGVNISQASIRTTNDQKAINIFEVEIKNTQQLRGVIRSLEKLSGIINVERIRG
jgi:guanosine-3',5'-bis(diphosphate) 3'-pyrophosphohydrolase